MSPFERTSEQLLFHDSFHKLCQSHYEFSKRAKRIDQKQYWDQDAWQALSEMGLFGLCIPEEYGGLGRSMADCACVMDTLGHHLVLEPVIPCLLGGMAIHHLATESLKKHLLPDMASGSCRLVCGFRQPDALSLAHASNLKAKKTAKGWEVSGRCDQIWGATHATHLLLEALDEQGQRRAFVLEAHQVSRQDYVCIDDSCMADVVCKSVKVLPEHSFVLEDSLYHSLYPRAVCLLAAEAVGMATALNQKTRDYTKQREQFGKPISKFQVLQHRMVEMFLAEEQIRSMGLGLSCMLDHAQPPHPDELMIFSQQVKLCINQHLQMIAETATQLHGGMGVSDELDIAHYLRRATCIRVLFGDHESCLAAMLSY
ncbi:MAG: acyl-CoA dehydrogenase family protein [Pseudomonadota bacterium]|nr:acyl-CoA dehydrogenase family protein [Pseudomonadota bacterium]